jgi:hypothetical protein
LRRQRAALEILRDQVAHLSEIADDARIRQLVAETPIADREHRTARTDLDRHRQALDSAERRIDDLLAERDQLLERLIDADAT